MRLHVAIALGLVGGLLLGLLAALTGSPLLLGVAEGVAPIGTAFVNLLRMVVFPLVAATLFVGVAGMSNLKQLGRLGGLTLLFFWSTTIVAILMGMGLMTLFLPLAGDAAGTAAEAAGAVEAPRLPGALDFLLGLIPSNPFQSAAEDALLPFIVFTVFFAAATAALPAEQRQRLTDLANPIAAALIRLVHWILWVAPLGVFALAAPVTARSGWAMLQSLAVFVVAVVLALGVFVNLVYVPLVAVLGKMRPFRFLRGCVGAQVIAFSTTSSAATIPAMLEAADELDLPRSVSSFVVPLGAALNRSGSALFQGASIVFLGWLYQVPLPPAGTVSAVLATFIVSLTVTGVPSASVLTLAPALGHVGLPLDGMAVLLGVDRIPDMFRTATNVTGDLAASAVFGGEPAQGRTAGPTEPPTRGHRKTDLRRMSGMSEE
jgi:Na+/H+-dicarboxylate symporter